MTTIPKSFIVPGGAQDASRYHLLLQACSQADYEPVPLHITWSTGSFNHYIAEARQQLASVLPQDLVIGFSYGALITMHCNPRARKLLLCSVPDPLDKTPSHRRTLNVITLKAGITNFNWDELEVLHQLVLPSPSHFFAGDQRVERIYQGFAQKFAAQHHSTWEIIPQAGHDINTEAYVKGLEKYL